MTDVCLCEYTSHGHCGVIRDGRGRQRRRRCPCSRAGRGVPRPGRRRRGRALGHDGRPRRRHPPRARRGAASPTPRSSPTRPSTPPAFYGPFREAADSAPQFGDRRGYQMDPANAREAMREIGLDVDEGADIVMVKPALRLPGRHPRRARARSTCRSPPTTSRGEYAMVKAAAANGWIDEERDRPARS